MSVNSENVEKSMKPHVETYSGFLVLLKWGVILSVLVLVGLAVFLVRGS
jgi:hypothetical protein